MSVTHFIDLCSDDEIGEAVVKVEKPDLAPATVTVQQSEYSKAEQVQQQSSEILNTRQESEESRNSNPLNTGQSDSVILDEGGSLLDVSSLSSTPPGCSAPLCRQFWKAGEYDVRQASRVLLQDGKNHVHVHPKFLHSNATSHKWSFGAIAELLDNAVDEIQSGATFVIIDKTSNPRDGSPALLIQDDGGGMDPDAMRRCMSFGFSDKKSKSAIGQYGNGFKTSTMRLGADVIVFSRHMGKRTLTQSVGLLSYSFLRQTGHDRIVVPMVDYEFNISTGTFGTFLRYSKEHFLSNLSMLLKWSPYATESDLLKQFDDIGHHGTKVIVYNLWLNNDGEMELDFESNNEDILIIGADQIVKTGHHSKIPSEQHIANRFRHSLRAYSSILYLRIPQHFRIVLRGRVVEHHNIANDLKFPEYIMYKPQTGGNMEAIVVTTIGFLKEAPQVNIHGFNIYHKNRLILPFWRVVRQTGGSRGRGVVGILEANFIEPTHDKQDFEKTTLFQKLETRLKEMTFEYWDFHCELIGYHRTKKSPATPVPPQELPLSGTYGGPQSVMLNQRSYAVHSPRVASSGRRTLQNLAATPTQVSVGTSRESISNNQTSTQHGLVMKRKEHDHTIEPERMKRQISTGANENDAAIRTQPQDHIDNQLQDPEVISLLQENKKLHAQCEEYEKMQQQLNLKVQRLRSELEEVQREYARLLAESQEMDAIKVEKL
ncbi:PREDICTED: protein MICRORCHIDIA 6 isoform X2 [Nelumbo nucifera]|nr:PREDICTED: protein MICRORCHIDIA 6 isoform X2 [Nelumbo nucifera]XP_010251157.1 PREDICTED: protein MICRORCHIDIA 6 isoform X2 [Nelumbo nucifera]XP_010251158.1 PREDICTED: protein MICRORCHIDIA 6 isoform X2 [Nelumbo nucifera]